MFGHGCDTVALGPISLHRDWSGGSTDRVSDYKAATPPPGEFFWPLGPTINPNYPIWWDNKRVHHGACYKLIVPIATNLFILVAACAASVLFVAVVALAALALDRLGA
jgi:hypothetical protein